MSVALLEAPINTTNEASFSDPESIEDGVLLAGAFGSLLSKLDFDHAPPSEVTFEDLISEREVVLDVDDEKKSISVAWVNDKDEEVFVARTFKAHDGRTMFDYNTETGVRGSALLLEKIASNLPDGKTDE